MSLFVFHVDILQLIGCTIAIVVVGICLFVGRK